MILSQCGLKSISLRNSQSGWIGQIAFDLVQVAYPFSLPCGQSLLSEVTQVCSSSYNFYLRMDQQRPRSRGSSSHEGTGTHIDCHLPQSTSEISDRVDTGTQFS